MCLTWYEYNVHFILINHHTIPVWLKFASILSTIWLDETAAAFRCIVNVDIFCWIFLKLFNAPV